METIGVCSSNFGNWSWDTDTLVKARSFLHQLLSLEFVVAFNIIMRILSSFYFLTVKLQKQSSDVLAAYEHMSSIQLDLELLKNNCEEEFHLWFHLWIDKMTILANKLNILVSTSQTASRQVHRSECSSCDSLTTIITSHQNWTKDLDKLNAQVKLFGLISSIAATYPTALIAEVDALYCADLPSSIVGKGHVP